MIRLICSESLRSISAMMPEMVLRASEEISCVDARRLLGQRAHRGLHSRLFLDIPGL